jgi:hypothetical protein
MDLVITQFFSLLLFYPFRVEILHVLSDSLELCYSLNVIDQVLQNHRKNYNFAYFNFVGFFIHQTRRKALLK